MCVSMAVWLCGEWRLLNVRGHFGTASTVGPFVLGSITHYRVVTRTRVYRIGYVCLALIERRKKIEQQHRGQAICPQNFIVAVVVVYFVWRFFLYIFFICHTLVRVRLHNDEREMHELSERVLNEKRQRWKYGIHKNQLLEFGVVCCWSRCFSFSRISPFGFIVHKCVVCCVLRRVCSVNIVWCMNMVLRKVCVSVHFHSFIHFRCDAFVSICFFLRTKPVAPYTLQLLCDRRRVAAKATQIVVKCVKLHELHSLHVY